MGLFGKIFGSEDSTSSNKGIEWQTLKSVDDLKQAIAASHESPVLLFKHSTRCSISSSALNRLERNWDNEAVNVQPFYLDLIEHRDISAAIASQTGIIHQSPQAILLKNGKAVHSSSHMDISFEDLKANAPA